MLLLRAICVFLQMSLRQEKPQKGKNMNISDIRIRKIDKEGKLKAVASITSDDVFVVHDIKIVEGDKGFFVAMHHKKVGEAYKDVAHPLKAETRKRISDAIFAKYEEVAGPIPEKVEGTEEF